MPHAGEVVLAAAAICVLALSGLALLYPGPDASTEAAPTLKA